MTKKEAFLNVKTYEEFDSRREEFRELLNGESDNDVLEHWASLYPVLESDGIDEDGFIDEAI